MAQGQLNGGGDVETIGDEVLMPYLERLDGSRPVEVINLAAFLQQGDISRLNLHELESDALTELFSGDDQQGQTVLPDALVKGLGDTGSVGRANLNRDASFGLKVTVDGRATYAAWTDPEANKADASLGVDDGGHYIRFFQAKDGSGAVIEGTFIGIQDYPGGGNFYYNDAMFLVRNVQPHVLTDANDTDGNGVNDALETDADNDGVVSFFDGDDGPVVVPAQSAFNGTSTPWAVDAGGLTLAASNFDTGGQGVAYNDTTPASLGDASVRPGEGVDISNGTGAIGYTDAGEWVEYTIELAKAGTYRLSFNSSTPSNGRTLTATFANAAGVYETAVAAVPNTGAYTSYQDTAPVAVTLQAGVQVLRVNFDLNQQDLMSFTLTPDASGNAVPTTTGISGVPEAAQGEAFSFDVSGFFADADPGDTLTFAATLPAGLSISAAGLISGTPSADGAFDITVTASDGQASIGLTFTLQVEDAGTPAAQAPFPGPTAPVIGADAVVLDAGTFDSGGLGVAWNDDAGRLNAAQATRADTDVELVGDQQDIGYVLAGEWVEYTIDVAEAGTYDLSVNAKTPIGGNTVAVSIEGGSPLATFALADSNGAGTTFAGTTFAETAAQQITLDAGVQTLRVAFDGVPASNGYLLDYRGLTLDKVEDVVVDDGAIGQAGKVQVTQANGSQWTKVFFDQALDDPSVVVGPLTPNDPAPATIRVRNVTDTGFKVQVDEWDYQDGVHGAETLQWVALEAGTHTIGGRTVVAGSGTATGNDTVLGFGTDAFGSAPIVFAQIASADDPAAATAQISSVTNTGFELDLDRQESLAASPHGTETVDWIAVAGSGHAAPGSFSGRVDGVRELKKTIALPGAAGGTADDFVFLADMQTERGTDPATVRLLSIAETSWTFAVAEEQSKDTEMRHSNSEQVGYLGLLKGLLYDDTPFA